MSDVDVSINNENTMRPANGRGAAELGRIDQYTLLKELGGGGFGTVYLARNEVSGVNVAVKGLPPVVRNNKEELEGIRRNFALVSRLHHPNIAAALDLHPAKDVAYASEDVRQNLRVMPGDTLMVMEFAPGVTLSQWRRQFEDEKVPPDKAAEVVRQVAAALDYAHERKIVHRDVKPANIMVETTEGGSTRVRVLDFGLAAEIRTSLGRVSREIRDTSGTRPYMAPEQWLGGRQGPATDQYSLAAMYHELVVGEVPFASVFQTGDPAVMMNVVGREKFKPVRDLPKSMRKALARALSKSPDSRFRSCAEFVAALQGENRHVEVKLVVVALAAAASAVGGWLALKSSEGAKESEGTKAPNVVEVATNRFVQPAPESKPTPAQKSMSVPLPEPGSEPVALPSQTAAPTASAEPKSVQRTVVALEQEPRSTPVMVPVPQKSEQETNTVVEVVAPQKSEQETNTVVEVQAPSKPVQETNTVVEAVAAEPKPEPKPSIPPPKPPEKRTVSVSELAALDVSGLKAGALQTVDIGDGVSIDLVWCPPGEFTMGSPIGEYGRGHNEEHSRCTVSGGFWMGRYEVTQAQWANVMGSNPSRCIADDPASQPVDSVNLQECQGFAAELNRRLGTSGFRLPSSVEWEYACRAGTTTPYAVDASGFNSAETRQKRSTKVGSYAPNPWGLCDMHGNLAEWTPDMVRGKMFQRNGVSLRGGCWGFKSVHCRSAAVRRENPLKKSPYYGLRICFDPKRQGTGQ